MSVASRYLVVLGHMENKTFSNCSIKPKLYIRYVDDISALLQNPSNIVKFHEFFNIFHNNSAFTREEENNVLPFLNVEVTFENLNLTIDLSGRKLIMRSFFRITLSDLNIGKMVLFRTKMCHRQLHFFELKGKNLRDIFFFKKWVPC